MHPCHSPSLGTFDKVIVSSGGNRGTSSQTGEGVTHCCFPSGGGRSLVPTQSTSRLPGRGSELRTHTGESRAKSPRCTLTSHLPNPDNKEILHSNVLDSHVPFLFRTSHQAGSSTSTLDSHVPCKRLGLSRTISGGRH